MIGKMTCRGPALGIVGAIIVAAACSGGNDPRPGGSAGSPAVQDNPTIIRTLDGIPGWIRDADYEPSPFRILSFLIRMFSSLSFSVTYMKPPSASARLPSTFSPITSAWAAFRSS